MIARTIVGYALINTFTFAVDLAVLVSLHGGAHWPLGLSITAAIVAAHGGTVSVAETPGGGATFRVALPLADPGAPGTVAEVDPHSNLSESTQDPRRHG